MKSSKLQPVECLFLLASFLVVNGYPVAGGENQPNRKPNVVFILADDLGWSDTTLFGTTKLYKTPNVTRLANRGVTFTRAYSSSPLCSPTRASILTGLNPARTGLTSPTCHLPRVVLSASAAKKTGGNTPSIPVQSVSRLDTKYYTLSRAMKDAGYATGHFGKWHLGHEPYSPLEHGFDKDVPHWPGPGPAGSYVAPWKFPDFDPDTPNQHIEDRMAKEAVKFMEENRDRPFFLNYWMFSVHAPFDAKQKLIEKYRGAIQPGNPQRSPTYAAMIESMDDAVGTLLDTIERLKIADNTIIVFTSDNGGNMYNEVDGTTPTSNTPLRGGKANLYEGGIRVPCVVSCPGLTDPGSRSNLLIQSCDFYPTLLDLIGIEPQTNQTFDGLSFAEKLTRESQDPTGTKNLFEKRSIITYFPHQPKIPQWLPPAVSIHQENWKLIRIFYGGKDGLHRYKLFDLAADFGETKNIARQNPQVVRRLDQLIEDFLVRTGAVQPAKNPNYDPANYDLAKEGIADLKRSAARKNRNGKKNSTPQPLLPKVAGWQPIKNCNLKLANRRLIINATGNDPHLSFELPKPLTAGKYVLNLTLSSTGIGKGQFFWEEKGIRPQFFRDRSKLFEMSHTGKPVEYRIRFESSHAVQSVRLDPGTGRGLFEVSRMTIVDFNDQIAYRWSFGEKQTP